MKSVRLFAQTLGALRNRTSCDRPRTGVSYSFVVSARCYAAMASTFPTQPIVFPPASGTQIEAGFSSIARSPSSPCSLAVIRRFARRSEQTLGAVGLAAFPAPNAKCKWPGGFPRGPFMVRRNSHPTKILAFEQRLSSVFLRVRTYPRGQGPKISIGTRTCRRHCERFSARWFCAPNHAGGAINGWKSSNAAPRDASIAGGSRLCWPTSKRDACMTHRIRRSLPRIKPALRDVIPGALQRATLRAPTQDLAEVPKIPDLRSGAACRTSSGMTSFGVN